MAVINLNNAPGAVPYVSMTDDQSNAVLINALNERTKQYENQLNAIAENEALLRQMKVRDADRAGSLVRAAKIASELDKEIQEKYAGDYASVGARKAVTSRLAQERGTFATLQQKYEEEQPYKQMYHQLKMAGQLAQKYNPSTGKVEEVNPFAQSIVDTEGNLISQTGIDYGDIRKKGDYIDYISRNIVDPLNKRMKDLGLRYTKGPFAFTKTSIQGKQVGMSPEEAAATVDDTVAKRFLEENPTFAFEYGTDLEKTKGFIKDIVRQKAIQQVDKQYGNLTDQWGMFQAKKKMAEEASKSPYDAGPFLPPSQERGEMNPFITERMQSGKTLQDMWKSTNMYGKGNDLKTTATNLNTTMKQLNQQKKQLLNQKYLDEGGQAALKTINYQIEKLKGSIDDFNKYRIETAERKANWFNQAAKSITGKPDASFKELSAEQKRQVRNAAPKTEQGWAKYFDEDLDGKTLTYRTQRPLDPDLQKYIGKTADLSGNYFRSSIGGTKSKNLDDVAKDSGISVEALREAIRTGAFPIQRIDATGEYAVRMPKDLKIGKTGKLDYSKVDDGVTLYFTFDGATKQISDMLRWAESTRFETGKKSMTFNTDSGPIIIEKTKQPNIFKINGHPITKEGLEKSMLGITANYLNLQYKTRLPNKKTYQPSEELLEE